MKTRLVQCKQSSKIPRYVCIVNPLRTGFVQEQPAQEVQEESSSPSVVTGRWKYRRLSEEEAGQRLPRGARVLVKPHLINFALFTLD